MTGPVVVPCSPAEVATYSDTRVARETPWRPSHWRERVLRERVFGEDIERRVVVLVLEREIKP